MTENQPSVIVEANPDEIVIVSAEPIQTLAWSRDIVFTYKGQEYEVTQWYDGDNGNSFTWSSEELDLDEVLDDAAFDLDTLAGNWIEDHAGKQAKSLDIN